MIIARPEPRRHVLKHVPGLDLLAQVQRQVEAIGFQPLAESKKIVLRELFLAEAGAGVEELELDEFVHAALTGQESLGGTTGQ